MTQQSNNAPFDFGNVVHSVELFAVSLINLQRENMQKSIDYVEFVLPQTLPPMPEPRNIIQQQLVGKAPISLVELEEAFDRIANDNRPRGVVLYLRGLAMPFADLQTLRDIIQRLRERGKRVITLSQTYSLADYYVASAADEILLQPGGEVSTTGLLQQQVYLKDGLNSIGIEWDAVQITPYKSASDRFTRMEPSNEVDEMTNWLLDSIFDTVVADIAAGRDMTIEQVQAMIDNAPHLDQSAAEQAYVDGLVHEETLSNFLKCEHILLWEQADNGIPLKSPRPRDKYIAVLYLQGIIINGESADPPVDNPVPIVGGPRIGDLTVVRQVRNLQRDDKCAGLVLYVNSGGGSATASEAMASALDAFGRKKPIVVYMGAAAASGGYYISTPADYIFAQSGTLTGSIGVILGKPVTNDVYQKLKFNAVTYQRGKNADINRTIAPFSDEQRTKVRASIDRIYEQFVERVAEARKMKPEQVDAIAGGRVWTGAQALENGLVDAIGGLHEAIDKARELANVPSTTPVGIVRGKGKPLAAEVLEPADPAASLRYWMTGLDAISGTSMMLMPLDITFE